MINKIRNSSLQTKIMIILMLMAVLLSLAFGTTFYRNTIDNALENKEKELLTLASLTSNKLERFLFERSADVKVLSASHLLTMPEISNQTKLNYLNNVINAYKAYDSIFVLDMNGETILTTSKSTPSHDSKSFVDHFLSKDSYVSDIIIESPDQGYIYFSEPLFDDQIHVGAVVERMNLESISEIVESVKFGETGKATLEKLEFGQNIDDVVGISHGFENNLKFIKATYPILKYNTQSLQWVLVISQNEIEALSVKKDIERYFLYVLVTSLIIFYLLSVIISRNITKPIRNLMEKTSILMDGHKKYTSDVAVSDEVKNLAFSFDILLEEMNFMMQKILETSGEAAYIDEIRNSIEVLFDNIPNGIMTIDSKGKIISINKVALEILEAEEDEFINRTLNDSFSSSFSDFIAILLESYNDEIQLSDRICRIKHSTGNSIPIVFSTLRQIDSSNHLIGITVVINNIEAKRKFDDSIFRVTNISALGELSAGVAHEIRNPLASIRGYAQFALRELEPDHQVSSDIAVILLEVDRLDKIIDRFMTFARPDQPHFEKHHMNHIIKDTLRLIKRDSHNYNIKLTHHFTTNDVVTVDYEQIKQVLINLIQNAVQSMPQGGEIQLVTYLNSKSQTMEIQVIDEGDGIPVDILEKVFNPFFTTRDKGTGLGLAICSRIVENHKGIIEISNNKEKGTRVTIKLPI